MNYFILFFSEWWYDVLLTLFFFTGTIMVHFFVRDKIHKKAQKDNINKNGPLEDLIHSIIHI